MWLPAGARPALLWVLAAAAGCAAVGPDSVVNSDETLLNSERIEAVFGSYGLELLRTDARLRVSNLYSVEAGRRVCRTFAVVIYPERVAPELAEAHARILAGRSIGETFAAAGWTIEKRHRFFGEIADMHRRGRAARLMGLQEPAGAAVHVYAFTVRRDGRVLEYAVIAEVHHPDYLGLDDLRALYGASVVEPLSGEPDPPLAAVLETVLRELNEG